MALEKLRSPLIEHEKAAAFQIPSIVKRNTLLIAAIYASASAGMGLLPSMGALMVVRLLGSTGLSGLALGMMGVSRFVVAYPMGIVADRYGRKLALALALTLGLVGAVLSGLSMVANSFALFLFGVFIFGLAVPVAQQVRVAATDMYPPQRRAEGLGYVVTASAVGSIGVTILVGLAQALSDTFGPDALALAWLLVPLVLLPALFLVFRVRPDPKEIAEHLEQYYPDYNPPAPLTVPEGGQGSLLTFLRHYPKLTVFICNFAVQGNMSMVMVIATLVLHSHGHSLPAIAFSTSIHSIGMFGFSIPEGWLADRVGRRAVMLAGVLIAGVGTPMLVTTGDYWIITVGFFLVGLGWSCVNVAGTALLADVSSPRERGRAIGASETFSGGANIVLALAAGPVLAYLGLFAVGVTGVALMVLPVALLLRLREPARVGSREVRR